MDIGFQERAPKFADRLVDVLFAQLAMSCKLAENDLNPLGKRLKQSLVSLRCNPPIGLCLWGSSRPAVTWSGTEMARLACSF
jgi:hypothetical protein